MAAQVSRTKMHMYMQVLSKFVSEALKLVGGSQAEETVKFTSNMDKFFDALNVANFVNGK